MAYYDYQYSFSISDIIQNSINYNTTTHNFKIDAFSSFAAVLKYVSDRKDVKQLTIIKYEYLNFHHRQILEIIDLANFDIEKYLILL